MKFLLKSRKTTRRKIHGGHLHVVTHNNNNNKNWKKKKKWNKVNKTGNKNNSKNDNNNSSNNMRYESRIHVNGV